MDSSSLQMLNFQIKCYFSPFNFCQYSKYFASFLIKKKYYFVSFVFLMWNITVDTQFLLLIVYRPEIFTHLSTLQTNKKLGKGNCSETDGEACIKLKLKASYTIGTFCTNCLQKSKQTKQKNQQPQFRRDLPAEWAFQSLTSKSKNYY